ncbi:MAG: hypothetical protein AB1403_15000 [Candidatus Riflebacteria bacterium]
MPVPCKDGCIMCGFCCIAYTIDDEKLHKPAFQRCQHLFYQGKNALCAIHDDRQPSICRDYKPEPRFRMMWFDDRLKYYRQKDYVEHLIWLEKNDYLDHLPVIQAIRNLDYAKAREVFKYFIRPHLVRANNTPAADQNWLNQWRGLTEYIKNAPASIVENWLDAEKAIKNLPQPRLQQILAELHDNQCSSSLRPA